MDSKTATNLLSTKTLVQFGLNRQPFMDKGSNRYIFEDSAISTQINVLINIIHGSDKIVMIKGENGVGKSSLLHKLAKIRHKGLTFCPIKATDKITIESLCKNALKHLEIPAPSSSASIPEFFAKRVAFRRRAEGKTVLLIDNADQLDSYTIDQLLLLRKLVAEDGVPAISIVFSGHPQLEQILTALPRINNHLSILHTIYLYPFSEKQTTDYINQRLQFACNNQDIELLTPTQIQSIHNRSKGIPALINYETCKTLETIASKGKTSIENRNIETGKSSKLVPAILITVATISLGFIGYLIYGHIQLTTANQESTSIVAEPISMPSKIVTPFKQAPALEQAAITLTDSEKQQTLTESVEALVDPVTEPTQDLNIASNEQLLITSTDKVEIDQIKKPVIDPSTPQKEIVGTTIEQQKVTKEPKVGQQVPIKATEKTTIPKQTLGKTQEEPVAKKQEPTKKQLTAETTQQAPAQKGSAKKLTTDSKPLAAEEAKKQPETKPTAKVKVVEAKTETKAYTKPATDKKQLAIESEQITKPTEKVSSKKIIKPSSTTDDKVKSWIKQQPALNYTMQLLAAQSDTALSTYKLQNPSLTDAKIALTLRKGKSWYILIIGSFKTTKEAKDYLSKQPAPINKSKPWIRRFKTLQQTLK